MIHRCQYSEVKLKVINKIQIGGDQRDNEYIAWKYPIRKVKYRKIFLNKSCFDSN